MKEIFVEDKNKVNSDLLGLDIPIFAKRDDGLEGAILFLNPKGWKLIIDDYPLFSIYYKTRRECIKNAINHNFTLYIA